MKGIIVTAIVGLVFFGGAYAYSTMQLVSQKAAEEEAAENEEDDIGEPEKADSTEAGAIKPAMTKAEATKTPVPFSPKALPEKALFELTKSIRQKEIELKKREAMLNTREGNFQFVLADIAREKREYESVIREAEMKVAKAQEILKLVEMKSQEIDNKMQQFEKEKSTDSARRSFSEEASDKQLAELLKSFDPNDIANLFEAKVKSGQIDEIGRILSTFDGVTMAKIVAAIPDDEMKTQAIDAVRQALAESSEQAFQEQTR